MAVKEAKNKPTREPMYKATPVMAAISGTSIRQPILSSPRQDHHKNSS
ncbi:MAG: hypothetical protein V3T04_02990 [Dehalococcoidia bacterium]